ncbi:hypothetical protein [Streptomyces sp. TRM68367]|uniref:hypothetical protein n=1 Tax=Streptomyces sp. TRM68367 TaxID=2758415 RepID=UPI00165B1F67|nr:hypothetical protein [Streptomyces sp. TRM68367]MBC9728849.1 hypothetical protein [Streptomyces sp. TRM68367]
MPEPYESVYETIPGAHPYPRDSRYRDAEIGVHRDADGHEVRYVKRRLLPSLAEEDESAMPHTVSAGERHDHLGQRYFGDPGQWWRIADANPVIDPAELTAEPGREIRIPGAGGAGIGR